MVEYHVGCGITGIYAGTLNKSGNMWRNKSDVTDEAVSAVALYLLEHHAALVFKHQGKEYRMSVEPRHRLSVEPQESEGEHEKETC